MSDGLRLVGHTWVILIRCIFFFLESKIKSVLQVV
jgi:hypothetical protein